MTTADQCAEVCRLWTESGREGSPWRPWMRLLPAKPKPGRCAIRLGEEDAMTILMSPEEMDEMGPDALRLFTPDPDDPATLGCLLGLVREVWGDPRACCKYDAMDEDWFVATPYGMASAAAGVLATGTTEAEALLAALIAGLAGDS